MQHRHMVRGEIHICHDLVLYQNTNYIFKSTPSLHEALDEIVMLEIGLYHNTFSLICVQHDHYTEHDTLCLSIFFYLISFYILPDH